MLAVHHLRKNYGSLLAVADVDFALQAGEILGYIGSNGAGKSTTVKIIAGLIEPSSGEVLFNGIPNPSGIWWAISGGSDTVRRAQSLPVSHGGSTWT